MKYKRFIDSIGGWKAYQGILKAAAAVGERHGVSVSNVATRWVLEQTGVAGVIIGARIGENPNIGPTTRDFFRFRPGSGRSRAMLDEAFAATTDDSRRLRRRVSQAPVS